jgi:hypothetical protein
MVWCSREGDEDEDGDGDVGIKIYMEIKVQLLLVTQLMLSTTIVLRETRFIYESATPDGIWDGAGCTRSVAESRRRELPPE